MRPPAEGRAVVAVDLGAQSCRISLLRWKAGEPHIELVHRIPNAPVVIDDHLRWNFAALCEAADEGLRHCAAIATEGIAAVGVTGWAVDYVRLEADRKNGQPSNPIADPFCYRDGRNMAAFEHIHQSISSDRLCALTGIQQLPFNTLYQLYADRSTGMPASLRWLNLPEYMLYRWGGRPVAEYTNATHTGLVSLKTKLWCPEIFEAAGLDLAAAPEIVPPGSVIGRLQGPLAKLPALRDTLLIAPACHDTASAIAGIPAAGNDWAYISSGTWSLVGTLLDQPCATPEASQLGFTNEGGVGDTICFLRNVNGLWLLSQCMEAWHKMGESWTTEALMAAASELPAPEFLLNVDDPDFIAPGNMPEKIRRQLKNTRGPRPVESFSAPAMANLIFHSLAARYASCLRDVEALSGKKFRSVFIVGGGSQNALLNRLTAQATGLDVRCGMPESSTIGNFSVQLAALANRNLSGPAAGSIQADRETVSFWSETLSRTGCAPASEEKHP